MSVSGKNKARRGFSLFGLLLIALGAVLLLNTTGVLPFGIWPELVAYWPVLLILVGIKIILAPRAPLICAGVIALILVGTVAAAAFSIPTHESDGPLRVTYVEPLGDTEILHLSMGFAGGSVELTSDSGSSSQYPALFAADFNNRPANVIRDRAGRVAEIYLSTEGPAFVFSVDDSSSWVVTGSDDEFEAPDVTLGGLVDWEILVSPDVAVELEINAGAADLDLDLQNLNVRRVAVGAGASDIRIMLPANAGRTHVEIAAGATDIEITVPQGVAARIENDTFLSSTQIDSTRFPDKDDVRLSPDYFTSDNRVNIEIDAFAADVTIS